MKTQVGEPSRGVLTPLETTGWARWRWSALNRQLLTELRNTNTLNPTQVFVIQDDSPCMRLRRTVSFIRGVKPNEPEQLPQVRLVQGYNFQRRVSGDAEAGWAGLPAVYCRR